MNASQTFQMLRAKPAPAKKTEDTDMLAALGT
jgi:hypothetical protein